MAACRDREQGWCVRPLHTTHIMQTCIHTLAWSLCLQHDGFQVLELPETSQEIDALVIALGSPELRCPAGGPRVDFSISNGLKTRDNVYTQSNQLACHASQPLVGLAIGGMNGQETEVEAVVIWRRQASTFPAAVLAHAIQKDICSLAWRTGGTQELAVGCSGGVSLWRLPADMAVLSSSSMATLTWLPSSDMLHHGKHVRLDSLAWHPDGHLLAAASSGSGGGFEIFDVARAETIPIKVRMGGHFHGMHRENQVSSQ